MTINIEELWKKEDTKREHVRKCFNCGFSLPDLYDGEICPSCVYVRLSKNTGRAKKQEK